MIFQNHSKKYRLIEEEEEKKDALFIFLLVRRTILHVNTLSSLYVHSSIGSQKSCQPNSG